MSSSNYRKCVACNSSPVVLAADTDLSDLRFVCVDCGAVMKMIGGQLVKINKTATVPVKVHGVAIPGATHVVVDLSNELISRIVKVSTVVRSLGAIEMVDAIAVESIRLYQDAEKSFYSIDGVEMVITADTLHIKGRTTSLAKIVIEWSSDPIPLSEINTPTDYTTRYAGGGAS